MKPYLLVLVLLFFSSIGCKKELPNELLFFENHPVENGKYRLYFLGTEGEWIEGYKDFYIDNIPTLVQMKKQWVFRHASDIMPCGYGYTVYLVNENKILKTKAINIEYEYMSGWIEFPKKYLTQYKNQFIRMNATEKSNFEKKYLSHKISL